MLSNSVLILLAGVAAASASFAGKLSKFGIDPVPELNVTQYLGRWYQMASSLTVNATFEAGGYCVNANYGLFPNGTVSVHNSQNQNSVNGPYNDIFGWAAADDASKPAALSVHLQGVPVAAPYWVVMLGPALPPKNQYAYAIVSDMFELSLFVLARNVTQFRRDFETEVYAQLKAKGYDQFWNTPLPTTQDGCTYEPEEPLEF